MWQQALLILEYLTVVSLVVFCSIKASKYIDMLDKTTKLSGAFLGGVLLSAITSLPELFTSISATLLIEKPALCLSNILGSNIFNMAVLALLLMAAIKHFSKRKASKGNRLVTLFIILIYTAMLLNMFNILDRDIATVNITSLAIVALYIFGVRYLAKEESEACDEETVDITLSTRQIAIRFTIASAALVALSIVLTYITDDIATEFNIGTGLAGAIFLGVATSLPEVSSTIALVRLRNYNIAIGNIVGSNLYNFFVLFVADLLCASSSIYTFSDQRLVALLEFGLFASVALLTLLQVRKKGVRVIAAIAVIVCYLMSLLRE